ncbi:MAG: hypothetical protein ACREKR_01325 [Candidatus Methylomirabilales bacterium]
MRTSYRRQAAPNKPVGAAALALVLAFGSGAAARSPGSPASVTPRASRVEPYRFFADRTVAVPLLVHAPELQGLTLHAELVQLASGFAVPVGAPLDVPLPTNASPSPGVEVELSIPLPAVKRETDFELRFRTRRGRDGVWHAAGRVPLRVYPGDLLSPVRQWATAHPLRVKDDQGSLIAFLRQQQIPVAGGETQGVRDDRRVTLYAGARALRERALVPLAQGEAIVLFAERETDTPRFLVQRKGEGMAVTVEMRLLDRLAADPLAQKIFLELFEVLNNEQQSMGGNDR